MNWTKLLGSIFFVVIVQAWKLVYCNGPIHEWILKFIEDLKSENRLNDVVYTFRSLQSKSNGPFLSFLFSSHNPSHVWDYNLSITKISFWLQLRVSKHRLKLGKDTLKINTPEFRICLFSTTMSLHYILVECPALTHVRTQFFQGAPFSPDNCLPIYSYDLLPYILGVNDFILIYDFFKCVLKDNIY